MRLTGDRSRVTLLQHLTSAPSVPLLVPSSGNSRCIVDFAIFCVLAAIGHRGVLLQWLRALCSAASAAAELTDGSRGAGPSGKTPGYSAGASPFARWNRRDRASRSERFSEAAAHACWPTTFASRSRAPMRAA